MAFSELALGWLIGLLSPGIVERIARPKRAKETRAAVGVELRELQFVLALVAFRLFRRCGIVTAERIRLIKGVVFSYSGPEDDPEGYEATKTYLSLPEPEQMAIAGQAEETTFNSPRLVKYYLPFMQSHMALLKELPLELQQRVSQINRDLSIFNDLADYCTAQIDSTFDSTLSEQNRRILQGNIEQNYRDAGIRAERILREIALVLRDVEGPTRFKQN